MEKTKCAVIQDDILAVKHALANGIAFEALEGDDLKELLATLQAQRAEVIAAGKRTVSASSGGKGGGGGGGTSIKPASQKPASKRSAPKASQGAQYAHARAEAAAAKDKSAGGGSASKRKSATPTKRPAPPAMQALQQQQEAQVAAKKPRVMSTSERLRQLRKSIRVRDVVSVLMDIPVTGAWIRSWVRGEVTREMNRSGIFQIAFDHDKHGEGTVKLEPSEGEDEERWIHEQRLEIDHPDFFCGQGSDPPRGPDDSRPRGSWYLHEATPYSNGDGN